jgi:hypothetical protein
MSALSPAPAPTSGVRWTDLPTPLESALPSCCLSYKQSAFLTALCFHNLTNPFSRKPFILITIRIARGCTPADSRFVSQIIPSQRASRVLSAACRLFFSLCPLFRARVVCFQRVTASFRKMPGWGRHPECCYGTPGSGVPPLCALCACPSGMRASVANPLPAAFNLSLGSRSSA